MNLAFWGFREWPFDRTFAANRFFATPVHDEALSRLLFLVEEQRRCGILLGPAGTGKTYLLRLLQERANRLGRLTVRCDATCLTGQELANQIATGIHVAIDHGSTASQIWSGIQDRMAALTLIRQPVAVIIDHFDRVESGVSQSICRLRQVADSVGTRLTILLGSRDRMVPAGLEELVELRIDLAAWTCSETSEFIGRSILDAGSNEVLFTDEALISIYELTNGIPVQVVTLCNLALLAAMGHDETLITTEIVESAASELPVRPVRKKVVKQKFEDHSFAISAQ